jgi:hypothetical protein
VKELADVNNSWTQYTAIWLSEQYHTLRILLFPTTEEPLIGCKRKILA